MKEQLLCRPCAENLKAEGKITIGYSMRNKQTCDCCGKRRFVYVCSEKTVAHSAKRKEE